MVALRAKGTAGRASAVRRKRFAATAERIGRYKRLATAARNGSGKKLFVAGIQPSACFAAEVSGVPPHLLRRLRAWAALALRPQAKGRSLRVCLVANGDPTSPAAVVSASRWAKEVWESTGGSERAVPLGRLIRWWASAQRRMEGAPKLAWRLVSGPASATWQDFRRIGWEWDQPCVFTSDLGERHDLRTTSWQAMHQRLREGAQRQILRELATVEWGDAALGARVVAEPVLEHLASRKVPVADAAIGRAVLCGAVWTRQRLAASGYILSTECPLCHLGQDSLHHRLWGC